MRVDLAYGRGRLEVELPETAEVAVVAPRFVPALPDPVAAVRAALLQPRGCAPMSELAQRAERVGIVFNDVTRPTPSELLVGTACEILEANGLAPEQITLFNATGTHRANSDAELREMLGDRLFERYAVVQNDAQATDGHPVVGTTSRGTEVRIHQALVACDLKLLTGFIEPHFFAGFSGGPKAAMPGMAALSTIAHNHSAGPIDHPEARWGIRRGNPLWEELRECVEGVGPCFLLNVTLNRDQAITGVFAGDLDDAHAAGCAVVREHAMVPVAQRFDLVLTSNSGYPLDQNLYQCVKGMSAAAQVVRPGGIIVVAAECSDGIPDHGAYGDLLRRHSSPAELLAAIRRGEHCGLDVWQAQIQARVSSLAEVAVFSAGLSSDQIRTAGLTPCENPSGFIASVTSAGTRICVLPEGPQTIGYVTNEEA